MTEEDEKLRVVPTVGEEYGSGGVLRVYTDPAGATPPSDSGAMRELAANKARSPQAAIERFLEARAGDLKTGQIEFVEVGESVGASVVRKRYEQRLNGLPVIGGTLHAVADARRNAVTKVVNQFDYDLTGVPDPADAQEVAALEPAILDPFDSFFDSAQVEKSALAYIRFDRRPPLPEADYPSAPLALLRTGQDPDSQLHLVHDAQVLTAGPLEVFRVIIDAVSAAVLYVEMLGRHVTANLLVFSPDPVSESNDGGLSGNSTAAALDGFRHAVQADVAPAAGGFFRLEGDWVRCTDWDAPNFAQPEEAAAAFNYQTNPADRRFLSANVYYWLDSVARYLQTLGVTELNNNIQLVEVDAQAYNGADQSEWHGTFSPPRIRFGEGGVPDAADFGVIIHEYAHGVFDWLGSNHGGSGSYEHSICDALPAIYRDRFNVNGHRRTETFPWDNNATNQWSTERTLNRAERFDDANFISYGANLRNSMLGTALWVSYIGMGGESSEPAIRNEAADAMIRTMMEMLLIVPDDFSTAVTHARSLAEGCIAADMALTGGLYSKVMDDAFIARGLWPLRPVDVYITDSSTDTASHPSPIPHWTSPDLWVRNNPPPGDNPALGHEPPINNQPNYLYVRVRNRGTQTATAGSFSVEAFRCDPGTGMLWPNHFNSLGSLPVSDPVPPGGSVTVGPFIWTPQIVGHECLLAVVHGAPDPSITATLIGSVPHQKIVRFDNNVGQRNVSPQSSVPGGKTKFTMIVRGGLEVSTNSVLIDATALPADSKISVKTLKRIVGGDLTNIAVVNPGATLSTLEMVGGVVGTIAGATLVKNDQVAIDLTIDFSHTAEHLKVYPIIVTQIQDGEVAGRLTIEIKAIKDLEDYYFGNPRSLELHVSTCPYFPKLGPGSKVPFATVPEAVARGYNGCATCLRQFNTG